MDIEVIYKELEEIDEAIDDLEAKREHALFRIDITKEESEVRAKAYKAARDLKIMSEALSAEGFSMEFIQSIILAAIKGV